MKKKKSLMYFTNMEFRFLVQDTDKKTLAYWAIDCAERVLSYFEKEYPLDDRPQKALQALQNWINTGEFSMSVIRKASLDAHAAARDVGIDNSARSAARACGQAVATAHVAKHALGSALYALQAIYRATESEEEVEKERKWQYQRLLELG